MTPPLVIIGRSLASRELVLRDTESDPRESSPTRVAEVAAAKAVVTTGGPLEPPKSSSA